MLPSPPGSGAAPSTGASRRIPSLPAVSIFSQDHYTTGLFNLGDKPASPGLHFLHMAFMHQALMTTPQLGNVLGIPIFQHFNNQCR